MPMTDRRLASLAKQHAALGEQIKDLDTQRTAIAEKIIAEMDRRGTKTLITGGIKVTRASNKNTSYDYEGIMRALDGNEEAQDEARAKKVDPDGLARLVTRRVLTARRLARFTTITESKPYVRTSPAAED